MAAAALAACNPRSAPAPGQFADSMRIRGDIEFLASDALEGRGTGTAGNDSAVRSDRVSTASRKDSSATTVAGESLSAMRTLMSRLFAS